MCENFIYGMEWNEKGQLASEESVKYEVWCLEL